MFELFIPFKCWNFKNISKVPSWKKKLFKKETHKHTQLYK